MKKYPAVGVLFFLGWDRNLDIQASQGEIRENLIKLYYV